MLSTSKTPLSLDQEGLDSGAEPQKDGRKDGRREGGVTRGGGPRASSPSCSRSSAVAWGCLAAAANGSLAPAAPAPAALLVPDRTPTAVVAGARRRGGVPCRADFFIAGVEGAGPTRERPGLWPVEGVFTPPPFLRGCRSSRRRTACALVFSLAHRAGSWSQPTPLGGLGAGAGASAAGWLDPALHRPHHRHGLAIGKHR